MSTNVPIISVTPHHHTSSSSSDSDSDSSNSHDNDMDYSTRLGNTTDVEDFDSQADISLPPSRRSSTNGLRHIQQDLTDVEDYDASDSEGEVEVFPELKLSLEEFLSQGTQCHQTITNGIKERVERRSGNFLKAQNLTHANDYLTDCEDYNTDSELENEAVKSVCVDLNEAFVDQGRVNIADATGTPNSIDGSDENDEDVSIASNISDLHFEEAGGACGPLAQALSEDELLELSGDEEICHIAVSDSESKDDDENISEDDILSNSSAPPLDVTFVKPLSPLKRSSAKLECPSTASNCAKSCMFLEVQRDKEEVLTDIEQLDENNDEDSYDDDDNPIPQAVILAVGDDGGCQTDCEDISYDDLSNPESCAHEGVLTVDAKVLPQPQREVILLQEDKYGDTTTSVMPMSEQHKFGINSCVREECVTDSEEFSYAADDEQADVSAEEPINPPTNVLVESDVTVSNEQMKPHISKRLGIQSNNESVTDVEEFYMDGTNIRKKKPKTRVISKGKSKYLDIPKAPEDGGTDVEDIELSEAELPPELKYSPLHSLNDGASSIQVDKTTDVEELTADDDLSSTSESDLPQINRIASNLRDYDSCSSHVVTAFETCASVPSGLKNKKPTPTTTTFNIATPQQQHTDTEDVQLPSDAEDYCPPELPSTCLPNELHELLNAGCTTVHEKCQNSFNVDGERLHIKGMVREAHTDVEYVESDESAARGSK
ncbi:uncharacterized protein LOC106087781 [Stomoxys calcitrans]|uniref:Uncharacterized protein n=1 Tax=Stomoxys calcitrans TaxID=35570 RepID=A0A1I8Q2X2_STOCA|nr:uncharacterized protein LOC106087781 [Stomoxys calcitrans]